MQSIFNVVLPVFAIILTDFLAGRFRFLGDDSSEALDRFVYYVALPVLLFHSMAKVEPAVILVSTVLSVITLSVLFSVWRGTGLE
jgi:predicted permease